MPACISRANTVHNSKGKLFARANNPDAVIGKFEVGSRDLDLRHMAAVTILIRDGA